jgi:hypothetical protein
MKVDIALLALMCMTVGCGTTEPALAPAEAPTSKEARQGPVETIPKGNVAADPEDAAWSLKAATLAALPDCTEKTEGRLAYVLSEKTAYVCESANWQALELRGRDGKDGESIVGERGERGEKGDRGDAGQSITGATGSNGADGTSCSVEDTTAGARVRCGTSTVDIADGATGATGAAGTTTTVNTSAYPNLRGANGSVIGQILQWDSAYTSYLVRAPSGARLRVGIGGTFRSYTFGYLTVDCTGPAYVTRVQELWEDVVDTPSGVKVRFGVPASRNFQSRKNGPTASCTTQANTWDTYELRALSTAEQADVWSYGIPYID